MARVNPIFKSPLINNPLCNGGKPKVVSIPVHFVGSETNKKKKIDPLIAAINVQRIYRGFVVRKNVKIVREIEAEVSEIEKKFAADGEMDSIVGDAKERLKINEMLMRLLFRLDSVRGVRDYRKRVIRRVILIQEMLDSISEADSDDRKLMEDESKNGILELAPQIEKPDQEMADAILAVGFDDRNLESGDQMTEAKEQLKVAAEIGEAETLGQGKPYQETVDSIPTVNQDLETGESKEKLKLDTEIGEPETLQTNVDQEMVDSIVTADQNFEIGDQCLVTTESKEDGAIKVAGTVETKPDQEMADSISTFESADQNLELVESMEIPQDSKPEVENADVKTVEHDNQALKIEDEDQISTGWELLETKEANDLSPANLESVILEGEDKKGVTKDGKWEEVMERMVAENEKLKGMVVELCQRSVQQCRLMGGLAERVERLEKVVQKMEKKTKKKRK